MRVIHGPIFEKWSIRMTRSISVLASVVGGLRLPIFVALLAGLFPTFAAAQPTPKPGKPHELLARDAGTWDCDVKMFLGGPGAPASEFKGVEINKLVSGGLYLQSSFEFSMGDRGKFEGHSLMGYNPRTKRYVGTWVDNFTSVPSEINGEYDEKSKTLTITSTVVDTQGNEMKSKNTTKWLDDSKKEFAAFLLVNAGGQDMEIKLMEMTATKRK
jgi:hypothetical protein